MDTPGTTIWTVGHSTLSFEAFLALLRGHGIETLADVRTVPKSRRFPHFHTDELARALPDAGVAYVHLAALGGFRRARADSPNDGWHNASFRGYADYAMTPEFAAGVDDLTERAAQARTAIMCSEAVWWRCHRRLVADRLLTAGVPVEHIGSDGRTTPHALTPFAVVEGDQLVYPAAASGAGRED